MTLHDTFNKSSINLQKVFIKLGLSASQFLRNWLIIYYPKTDRYECQVPGLTGPPPVHVSLSALILMKYKESYAEDKFN